MNPDRHRVSIADPAEWWYESDVTGQDVTPQVSLTYNRVETYDAAGRLLGTEIRKLRTRWWHRDEFVTALRDIGFTDVKLLGDELGWVALAIRP